MPNTLTGWGVRDPEGRLLRDAPLRDESSAWLAATNQLLHALANRKRLLGWGDLAGIRELSEAADLNRARDELRDRLRALGYRVVRVELREVPE